MFPWQLIEHHEMGPWKVLDYEPVPILEQNMVKRQDICMFILIVKYEKSKIIRIVLSKT